MSQKINGRVAYADLLRVFATIAVIVLHLCANPVMGLSVSSQAWQIFNIYDGLVRWCVPVFVMLSGMFMLDPKRPLPLVKLLFHNALRILISLVFWIWVYAVVDSGNYSPAGLWNAFLHAIGFGDYHFHLWCLFMILGLYLVTPILRAFCRGASRSDFHYFFLIAFLFASLLPTAFTLWPNATNLVHIWYDRLSVRLVLGYVGYYVAGYYLKEYTISRLAEAVIYVLGVLGAVATVWGTSLLSRQAGGFVQILYDYTSPNVCAFAVAIVVLFRYVLGVSEERSRRQRLSGVAKISFGIYLVHELFIILLKNFGITALSFAPVASVPALTAVVFLCSFAVAWLISKIPFVGHYLT